MNTEQSSKKSIFPILLTVIEAAIVIVAIFRKYIFPPDSMLYNLYEDSLAEDPFARILQTIVALCAGLLVAKLADAITDNAYRLKSNKAKTTAFLLGNIMKYAAAIGVIFACLSVWGMDTTAIATGAGVITLILGLGCQSMIADVVAGVFLLFEGDIQVGDVVVIDDWRGTVQQIGLRRTKLMDIVGNVNIINNSSISSIINNTKELSYAVCEMDVDYSESIERVEEIIKDNLPMLKDEIPGIIEGPYYLGISGIEFQECMTLELVAKVKEQDKYQVQRDMNRAVKILFDRNGINISSDDDESDEAQEEDSGLTDEEIRRTKELLQQQRESVRHIN